MYVSAALAQSTYKFGYGVRLCGYLYTFFAEINFQSALAGGLHTYSSRNRVFNVCDLIMHPKINSNSDITRTINNINITDKNPINIMDVTMFSKLFI